MKIKRQLGILGMFWILAGAVLQLLTQPLHAAGVTVITHGFQIADSKPTWMDAMATAIAQRAGPSTAVIELDMNYGSTTRTLQSGVFPAGNSANAEVIVKVYWHRIAAVAMPDSVNTTEIATQILPYLTDTLAWNGPTTPPFGQMPLHLIGHSRGGSVVSELARLLGERGIWVSQLTTLDPHPVRPFHIPSGSDAEVRVWETVLFANNFYQDNINPVIPDGVSVPGAANRLLSLSPGAYPTFGGGAHSDIHLWYYGTVNTGPSASNGDQIITDTLRTSWYRADEYGGQKAGFYYSRLGGGEWALDGFLFGYNDGNHNPLPDTRTALTRSASEWPSFVALVNNASGSVQAGNAFPLQTIIQSYGSSCSLTLNLDPDQNPYNGNETALVLPANLNPQTATGRATRVLNVNATVPASTSPRSYYVYAKITNPNGTRYQYVRNQIQVTATGTSPAPTIASVLPGELIGKPLPETQPIRILGSGFTASSTLLFNGSIASDPARLHFISANELQYDIRTGTEVANWTVRVINGAQQSNLGYFSVVNPPPNTGSLTVNLSPAGAVSAGAQWRVDGGNYRNSGDTVTGLTPGSHPVSFKTVSGYTTPANQSANILANQQAMVNASYTPVTSPGQTLSVSTTTMAVGSGTGGGNFFVQSDGSGTLNWSANTSDTWLTILTPSGTIIGQGGQNRLDFSFSQNPSAGSRTGTITITANGASGSPQAVTITQAGLNNSFFVVAVSAQHGTVTKNPHFPAYPSGGVVELTAVPDSGYQFSGWSGDITDSQNPVGVLMDGDKNITANFVRTYFVLTVSAQYGTVTKNPNQSGFTPGTVAELTAVPNNGYQFSGWSGDITDSQNPVGVLMDGDKNVAANFTIGGKIPQTISFGALSRQVLGDAPFALSATASSGLPVAFTVLSGPALVSGNVVTLTGAGMVVLRAAQAGDDTYAPAPPVDQVLLIAPGNNLITDVQRLANGMFTFRFYGEPGTNYVVQGSTNLVTWTALATNQVSGLGYFEFTDVTATGLAQRFYRVVR